MTIEHRRGAHAAASRDHARHGAVVLVSARMDAAILAHDDDRAGWKGRIRGRETFGVVGARQQEIAGHLNVAVHEHLALEETGGVALSEHAYA